MQRIIIIGGVSVDPDDKEHDKNPYNYINPGVKLAKQFAGSALLLMHAASYEIRVKNYPPKLEHRWVADTEEERKKKQKTPDHFFQTVKKRVSRVRKIESAADLTKAINSAGPILSIHYFGHANKDQLFLEYNTDGSRTGLVVWGLAEAQGVSPASFNEAQLDDKNPYFASYGCYQGEASGLCPKLQKLWFVKTLGAEGKTNYDAIGENKSFPYGTYYEYPLPVWNGSDWDFGKRRPVLALY